jgi:Zn-dependent protease
MIQLLFQQQYALFILIMIALIISLTFHEYGHAIVAKFYGDNTAEQAGRLTLNPMAHIDPLGLLMVALIGIGYAKPVPTNPANFTSRWATPLVALAGPAMNLFVAIIVANLYEFGIGVGWSVFEGPGPEIFFYYLVVINLLLMLFNLIPIGPLDGHYILPYFLPRIWALRFHYYNQRYGVYLLLGLIALHFVGVPIFEKIWNLGNSLRSFIVFV